jgi:two-component system, chemotaxis family, CheB/CheR fusion protein
MDEPVPPAATDKRPMATRIVGVGASAGGLEPLEQFLSSVPSSSGLAYVVVQHMDPTHKALLGELLQRATSMPVHQVADSRRVNPDEVYVIPPDAELTVAGGALRLAKPSQPRGQRLPIDVLFSSLASELGDRAIGVVLSGMGSDGTLGLQAIKSAGGLTLVQQPASAQFDSMPKSAIVAGCADIIALPAEMPARILRVTRLQPPPPAWAPAPLEQSPSALTAILTLLHEHTRHDLSQYKTTALSRRIARRMAVHGLDAMEVYADFLRQNPQEVELLFKEMLIGVTSFFRDPEAWQELKDAVLPALLARQRAEGGRLRAWVVGCSTGEEAYSLAMAFTEVRESMPQNRTTELQIFATDLKADAVAVARNGQYPATIARDLTPERLRRFFTERAGAFLIHKQIREMVLFAQHDVILDPPFTRLDFLSCRNLMIYFDASLQKRLVRLFHYSLRPGGALLLGGSETVGRAQLLHAPAHQVPVVLAERQWQRRRPVVLSNAATIHVARRPAGEDPGPSQHSTRQPAGACRSGAAARLLASGGPGQRSGRHPLHQRPHGRLPRAGGGQGELEHPRDGAPGHPGTVGGGPEKRPARQIDGTTAGPAAR